MTPPTDLDPAPVALVAGAGHGVGVDVAQLGQAAVGQAGEGALEAHQRVVADVEARASPSRRPAGATCRTPCRGSASGRRRTRWSALVGLLQRGEEGHDPCVVLPAPREGPVDDLLEHQAQALAGMAQRVEGARLDQRLHGALVEHQGVDPLAEVVEVDERAVPLPLGHDQRHQASPTLRMAARPKVMAPGLSPEVPMAPSPAVKSGVNSASDRLMSGTRTSMPIDRHSPR